MMTAGGAALQQAPISSFPKPNSPTFDRWSNSRKGSMRSLLFAGATRPDLVAKLGRSSPDAVAIDLEEAVPAAAKDEARAALPELVRSVEGPRVLVRVNGPA